MSAGVRTPEGGRGEVSDLTPLNPPLFIIILRGTHLKWIPQTNAKGGPFGSAGARSPEGGVLTKFQFFFRCSGR